MADIDIGIQDDSFTIGNLGGEDAVYTALDLNNPANADGILTSIRFKTGFYAALSIYNFKVGTCYLISGTTYKNRDAADLGMFTTDGTVYTITGLEIEVAAGDLLANNEACSLYFGTTGGAGVKAFATDGLDGGEHNYNRYDWAGFKINVYGEGSLLHPPTNTFVPQPLIF